MKTISEDAGFKQAVAGQYNWQIRSILKEAWQKVKGVKASYWGAFALFMLITFALWFMLGFLEAISHLVGAYIYSGGELTRESLTNLPLGSFITLFSIFTILRIAVNAMILTLIGGIISIGISRSVDKPVKAIMVFRFFKLKYMLRFLGLVLLFTLIFAAIIAMLFFPSFIPSAILSFPGGGLVTIFAFFIGLGLLIYFSFSFVLTIPLMVD